MTVAEFLKKYGLVTEYDMDSMCRAYLSEMQNGLDGNANSLAMLPAYLSADNLCKKGGKCVVIDAGGTNLRAGVVSFDGKAYKCGMLSQTALPGSKCQISADGFFDSIAQFAQKQLSEAQNIGFCFSYPAIIDENVDASAMEMTKEVRIDGIRGRKVGEGLLQAIKRVNNDFSDRKIAVLNDTVAVLLDGMTTEENSSGIACVGMVFGTGVNVSYIESVSEIKKLDRYNNTDSINADNSIDNDIDGVRADGNTIDNNIDGMNGDNKKANGKNGNNKACDINAEDKSYDNKSLCDKNIEDKNSNGVGSMVINVEAGNFDKFARSSFDDEVISASETGEAYIFEKMTAGRYLGKIASRAFAHAGMEGLISFVPDEEMLSRIDTVAINKFLKGEDSILAEYFTLKDDVIAAKEIISAIIKRSASMCAVMISAIILRYTENGRIKYIGRDFVSGCSCQQDLSEDCYAQKELQGDRYSQAIVFAEGSSFKELCGFSQMLDGFVNSFLLKKAGVRVTFKYLNGSTLGGSAAAILSRTED